MLLKFCTITANVGLLSGFSSHVLVISSFLYKDSSCIVASFHKQVASCNINIQLHTHSSLPFSYLCSYAYSLHTQETKLSEQFLHSQLASKLHNQLTIHYHSVYFGPMKIPKYSQLCISCSVSYQLARRKSKQFFKQLKYLIECTSSLNILTLTLNLHQYYKPLKLHET